MKSLLSYSLLGSQTGKEYDEETEILRNKTVFNSRYNLMGQVTNKSGWPIWASRGFYQFHYQYTHELFGTYYDAVFVYQGHVPNRDLNFYYSSGKLIQVVDKAHGKTVQYSHDHARRLHHIDYSFRDGEKRTLATALNARGAATWLRDTQAWTSKGYDRVLNERYTSASFVNGSHVISNSYWSTYDRAERVLIDRGDLVNGQVVLSKNKGAGFAYSQNLRSQETQILDSGTYVNTISYDPDQRVTATRDDAHGSSTTRTYNESGMVVRYQESSSAYSLDHQMTLDINNRVTHDSMVKPGYVSQVTDSYRYTRSGQETHRHTDVHSNVHVGFYLDTHYQPMTSNALKSITGSTYDDNGSAGMDPTNLYYDANGILINKVGSDNGQMGLVVSVLYTLATTQIPSPSSY